MGKRLPNPRLAKIHRNYTIEETANLFRVHKNTVGSWIKQGLPVCGKKRPFLILGRDLRIFLEAKKVKNKRPCKPDEIYCVRCRVPKKPDADLIEYRTITNTLGNLVALCPDCESIMNRRISLDKLKQIPAYSNIAQSLAGIHITTCINPTVNSDFSKGKKYHA
ncbi:MAG TPA: helix-turn-helix domain-containing protein [Nitrosomonas nitrosa]|nr:helix-turn-helix domain-containing protein [Nitrosomonas nitrosa]